jgi:transcriptional regulator with XRE-family HTH domain
MIAILTVTKAQETLAENVRARRLAIGLTQAGLASRSGVPLGTLRKFERTGAASVETLFKLLMVVGGLERMIDASAPEPGEFASIEEVLEADRRPARKHGWRT